MIRWYPQITLRNINTSKHVPFSNQKDATKQKHKKTKGGRKMTYKLFHGTDISYKSATSLG